MNTKKELLLFILFFALIALLLLVFNLRQPLLNQSLLASKFPQYTINSSKCFSSSYLFSSGINLICTEVLRTKNTTSLPSTIVLTKYVFSSPTAASLYLQNLTSLLNSTPWPVATRTFSGITNSSNVKMYFTAIEDLTNGNYIVATSYLQINNIVFSSSAEGSSKLINYSTAEKYSSLATYLLFKTLH